MFILTVQIGLLNFNELVIVLNLTNVAILYTNHLIFIRQHYKENFLKTFGKYPIAAEFDKYYNFLIYFCFSSHTVHSEK